MSKKAGMYYKNDTILYLDGAFLKASEANASLYGQSLHYGYAVFEGIRSYAMYNGGLEIFKAKEHYERLHNSAAAIGIPYGYDNKELIDATYTLLQKNNLTNAYIRPLVFCPPGMSLVYANSSHIMIAVWEWGSYLGEQLLRVQTSSFQRPNPQAFKLQAKVSGHYVNSIMATQEAKNNGYDEALLLDMDGYVAEGPGANVFYEKDGILYTPQLGNILPGITRNTVLELCYELLIPVCEKRITLEELKGADAVFYCGTAAEIIGWESLDKKPFAKPWEASLGKIIQEAYKRKVIGSDYKHLMQGICS